MSPDAEKTRRVTRQRSPRRRRRQRRVPTQEAVSSTKNKKVWIVAIVLFLVGLALLAAALLL